MSTWSVYNEFIMGNWLLFLYEENETSRAFWIRFFFFLQVSFNFLCEQKNSYNWNTFEKKTPIIRWILIDFWCHCSSVCVSVCVFVWIWQQWHFRMKMAMWNLCNDFQYGNVSLVADFHFNVLIINLLLPNFFCGCLFVCVCVRGIKSRYTITVNCYSSCFCDFRGCIFLACRITLITNINHVHVCVCLFMCLSVRCCCCCWLPSFSPKIIHMHFQYCSAAAFHIYA